MKQYTTFWQGDAAAKETKMYVFTKDMEEEQHILNLYPDMRFQTVLGFGGAFTEAAGSVLEQMPAAVQEEILQRYFSKNGLGYTFGRTHIDSCDFSLGNHSAVTDAADTKFDSMEFSREERYVLPYFLRAQQIAGTEIRMLMAPWSPPAFMKTNGQRNGGGALKPEYRDAWARYMAKYVKAMEERGMKAFLVGVQNEPKAVQTWDSCVYTTAQEQEFARDYLAPALQEAGIQAGISVWDHNKERLFDRTRDIVKDPDANAVVSAFVFHWYSGDHFEAIELAHHAFPDKWLIFSEGCVEYSRFSGDQLTSAQMYAHDILGNLNAGMHAFVDWNLVLNKQGGPNHVGNLCDAPIMCDTENGTFVQNLSFDYIGHFSRYIQPGAVRIGKTLYTTALEACAFQNPDHSIACVVLNRGTEDRPVVLRGGDKVCRITAAASSISTVIIQPEELQ